MSDRFKLKASYALLLLIAGCILWACFFGGLERGPRSALAATLVGVTWLNIGVMRRLGWVKPALSQSEKKPRRLF